MTTLEKTFRFEAAHRLGQGYMGKCRNIHGHSWNGKIVVGKDDDELDKFGMLADFSVLKEIISPRVDELDHTLILCKDDAWLISVCKDAGWKTVLTDLNPTSEVIARMLFAEWSPKFAEKGLTLLEVVIEETCTSRCTVTRITLFKSFTEQMEANYGK